MGPHDDAILEHLTDVRVVAAPASAGDGAASRPPGYRVELRFDSAENPFFTDESLWAAFLEQALPPCPRRGRARRFARAAAFPRTRVATRSFFSPARG